MSLLYYFSKPASSFFGSVEVQLEQLKEVVHEKDIIARNHLAKIKELEFKLAELKSKQAQSKVIYEEKLTDQNNNFL